jgi:hypothetical protein
MQHFLIIKEKEWIVVHCRSDYEQRWYLFYFFLEYCIQLKMRRISPRSIVSAIGLSLCFVVLIFIFNNLNSHNINEPDVLPIKCDCPALPPQIITPPPPKVEIPVTQKIEPSTTLKVETPPPTAKVDVTHITKTTPPFPPCKLVENSSAVQRAIIIYYPHHQSEYFFPEVRW